MREMSKDWGERVCVQCMFFFCWGFSNFFFFFLCATTLHAIDFDCFFFFEPSQFQILEKAKIKQPISGIHILFLTYLT